MYSHTKKVGSVGRYGPRVGRKLRYSLRKIEDDAKKRNLCPECSRKRLKRKSTGVWRCRGCGVEFTSGAYIVK
ncbi:MAG: 50S ribosomal protein L37ae [Candidatus Altiarchaeales archaeon]|nr:50S ribosomal protein L37ae [Candidatus Altiarchaeales archaeon]